MPKKVANNIVNEIEKKFGVSLDMKTDTELFRYLEKVGLPSLAKALKLIHKVTRKISK